MDYTAKLEDTRSGYPFDRWREMFYPDADGDGGMEQYTEENCRAAARIFDSLIDSLADLGEDAPDAQKVALFEEAVKALNVLNDTTGGSLIETGEREDLCELVNQISIAAGLDPEQYGDGEGLASEWRDW